jgi:predicted component of type VI protein secretion system
VRKRTLLFMGGALAGLVAGAALAQGSMSRWRNSLFSARPLRRLAALGYLSGHPSPAAVGVLRDYLTWEEHPALRRRAESLLQRMETNLD